MKTIQRLSLFFFATCVFCSVARGQLVNDRLGFAWDFDAGGSVNDGSDDAFDGAYQLYVNSNQFMGPGPIQKDGMLVFGPQVIGGFTVTRYVIPVEDPPGMFYAEHIENLSDAKIKITPMINSDFGETAVPVVRTSDDGKMLAMSHPHANPRPHLVHIFGNEDDEYLPTLNGTDDVYQFNFQSFEMESSEKRTIGYFVAQRTPAAGPKLLADEEAYSKAIEKALAIGIFSFPNSFGTGIFNTGQVKLTMPNKTDFISTKKKDQVFGKLLVEDFVLETELGSRKYPIDQILNIVGTGEEKFRIIGVDGSILDGKLLPKKIRFELSDGIEGEIETSKLDRIVPRLKPSLKQEDWKKGKWFEFEKPVFVYKTGERLTGDFGRETIDIHTEIGKIALPVNQLISIKNSKKPNMPSRFLTKDGQTFSGMLYDPFEVTIFDGSSQTIYPKNLSSVFLDETGPSSKSRSAFRPYLKLSGQDFLYVKLLSDKTPLEFTTAFGIREMSPEQISSLKSKSGFQQGFEITLWDDSTLNGQLKTEKLSVEILGTEMQIPASQLMEYYNPMSLPPIEIRKKYIELIHQLGSKKYDERANAIKQLEAEKKNLRGLFKSQMEKVSTEAKAQIWKLLPPEDRPKKVKKKRTKPKTVDETKRVNDPPR